MLGIGAYAVPEAARLIGASSASVRRWVLGYQRKTADTVTAYPPVWPLQHEVDEAPVLGFRDLIESRFVNALRKAGISMQTVRVCLDEAAHITNDDHPFSSSKFHTDGKRIFLEITRDSEEPELIDLKSRQQVFHRVVAPSFRDLEFDDEAAIRWWPLKNSKRVVIDPQRAFGQPILAETGVSTARVAEAFEAEGRSMQRVAKLYEVPPEAVRDALAFEERLRGPEPAAAKAA